MIGFQDEDGWEECALEVASGKTFVELHPEIFDPAVEKIDLLGLRKTEFGL